MRYASCLLNVGEKNGFDWIKYDFFSGDAPKTALERVFYTPYYYGINVPTLVYLFPLISPIFSIRFGNKWREKNNSNQ